MANPKILIVDDELFNRDYLEQELEELDCEILSAANGQEALDLIQSEPPDLVLLDIMMPVMDGFTVLSRLKSNSDTRDIPVIVISANNDLHSVVRGIQSGAEDYLPKPFEPVLLHARISSSLEKKRLRDVQQLYWKSLERELEIAREIQAGFLPAELPRVKGWEVAAYFQAAKEVAGDFYDVFQISGSLVCVVGDVCGKGVGAALFMTLFRSLIRSAFNRDHFQNGQDPIALVPRELLQQVIAFVNAYVAEVHSEACMFSTVFIGVLDLEDGTLTYVNCGNEPPLIIMDGLVTRALSPTGPVVGIFPEASFTVQEDILKAGEVLLAFTDGIPDALNSENERFGTERLRELIGQAGTSPREILNCIEEQVQHFIDGASQFDDITVLAVRREA